MHISWAEEALDFCFAFLCKYAKWLNIKGRRLCFLIWMVCGVYWFVVDIQRGLYAQALFCIPTILFQAYGFYEWKRSGFGESKAKKEEPIKAALDVATTNTAPMTSS